MTSPPVSLWESVAHVPLSLRERAGVRATCSLARRERVRVRVTCSLALWERVRMGAASPLALRERARVWVVIEDRPSSLPVRQHNLALSCGPSRFALLFLAKQVAPSAHARQKRELRSGACQAFPKVPVLAVPEQFIESADLLQQAAAVDHAQRPRDIHREVVSPDFRRLPERDPIPLSVREKAGVRAIGPLALRERGRVRAAS